MKDFYTKEELLSIFKNRFESRHVIYDDIYLDSVLIAKIIKNDPYVSEEYEEWVRSLGERSIFITKCGNIQLSEIERLWINLFEVYILKGKKECNVLSPGSLEKPLWVNSIEDVELQITDDVKSHIKKKRKDLVALPDLTIVLNEVCGEMPRKTTYKNTEEIKNKLLGIDETKELLDRMSYELFLDLKLIFDDMPIYWGKR